MHHRSWLGAAALVVFSLALAYAQTDAAKAAQTAKPLSPTARLTAARTLYLKNAGGSDTPFDVISQGVQGWGRYQIVNAADKADIVAEVTSHASSSGISVSTNSSTDPQSGFPTQSTTTSRELTVSRITLIVYDAKSKMALWSASEQPKGGMREKSRQDNVVEAAERLVTKFRERVEPDAPK